MYSPAGVCWCETGATHQQPARRRLPRARVGCPRWAGRRSEGGPEGLSRRPSLGTRPSPAGRRSPNPGDELEHLGATRPHLGGVLAQQSLRSFLELRAPPRHGTGWRGAKRGGRGNGWWYKASKAGGARQQGSTSATPRASRRASHAVPCAGASLGVSQGRLRCGVLGARRRGSPLGPVVFVGSGASEPCS